MVIRLNREAYGIPEYAPTHSCFYSFSLDAGYVFELIFKPNNSNQYTFMGSTNVGNGMLINMIVVKLFLTNSTTA